VCVCVCVCVCARARARVCVCSMNIFKSICNMQRAALRELWIKNIRH